MQSASAIIPNQWRVLLQDGLLSNTLRAATEIEPHWRTCVHPRWVFRGSKEFGRGELLQAPLHFGVS
eukprot:3355219-Prorocentrum_lima.AAC.1